MLVFIIIILLLVCATNSMVRTKEQKKVDFITGLSIAVCIGSLIGLLIYKFA